ncbi:MAG: hypothetical protein MRJ93_15145 [Nitrososphaeraceae archaeon]|nr:hypothetical protein [Nitrososphaeraceae archaeon]
MSEINKETLPLNEIITKTSFHLSYDLLKKLKCHAIDSDQTLSGVINDACYEYLDKRNYTD